MMRFMLKSKIFYAQVTEVQLYYRGSITIDKEIMEAAGIVEGEKVDVLNMNTGSRIETYVIAGEASSRVICLNGPAARTAYIGDKLIILSYGLVDDKEIKTFKPLIVELDEKNKIKNTSMG